MVSKEELRPGLQRDREAFVRQRKGADFRSPAIDRLWLAVKGLIGLAGYAALKGEPDVELLLAEATRRGMATGLPCMDDADAPMSFRCWSPGDALERSPFGFRQPSATAPALVPEVVLVPLVGFDRAMRRVGHGKGHYDRGLLALPRALKIGIAWSIQEVSAVPPDPWDIPLDAVLTEREWIAQ